jgi:drug/metabolite transporter (DMT)-like permease
MPYIGELSALLTAFLWASSAMVFASAIKRTGSFQVNITRLILAAIYLIVFVFMLGLDINLSLRQYINLCISGFIGLSLGDTFLFKAFQEIGARISMLIMSLAPAIAAALAYFFLGETISSLGVVGMIVTIFGISLVVFDRSDGALEKGIVNPAGIIYALLGAIGQGVSLIFAKMAFQESDINGFVASAIRITTALIFLLPLAMATSRFESPVKMLKKDKRAFYLTAVGALLGSFLGISFSLIAIDYTDVGVAATIMAIVPIIMLPIVWIIYKEKLNWRAVTGAFVAVGGVALLFLR